MVSSEVIMKDPNIILFMRDVYKAYGPKMVLDNVDLAVERGEFCTIVGPSGCGKSTFLRLILGQERPTSGAILIDGEPAGGPNAERGIVYQKYSLFPHLSVLQNILLGKRLSADCFEWFKRKKEFRDEVMSYLERMRLSESVDKYPHELSGGMQQRVAIAQSLVMKPRILLMDEPFGALDPGTREEMQVFLLELWEEYGMTIFFVTHDLEEAVFLGTRIVAISQFYSDDRGDGPDVRRGAKIVCDYALPKEAQNTAVKETAEIGRLIQQIRREAFDPAHLQHALNFNLKHPSSFQDLTPEEIQKHV